MTRSAGDTTRKVSNIGVALLVVSSVALLLPPQAVPPRPPAIDATFLERLFPGVPIWWVAGRLLCLLLGAILVSAGPGATRLSLAPLDTRRGVGRPDVGRPLLLGMLVFSAALAALSFFAAHLDREGQLAYLACLALPALAARFGASRHTRHDPEPLDWKGAGAIAAIIVVWLATRAVGSWNSPWIATPVDAWTASRTLQTMSLPTRNVLTDAVIPGFRGTLLVLQGGGWLTEPRALPRLQTLLFFNTAWSAVSALLIAWLVRHVFGASAASIAVAAFLFAPVVTVSTIFATAYFLGPLVTVALLVLLWKVHVDRSMAALLALGPLAGVATTYPSFVPLLLFGAVLVAMTVSRQPRFPIWAVLAAVFLFFAAAVPGLPSWSDLRTMHQAYARGTNLWSGMESMFFGQLDPHLADFFAGSRGPASFDLPLGALLTPFATPRTALRLWGDTAFDPIGGALAAVGIATCVRGARFSRAARLLLLLLGTAVLPGFLSSYDRVSLLRMVALPVAVSLLAAVGFRRICIMFDRASRGALAAGLTVAIIVAGTYSFEGASRRILAQSAMTISLRAARTATDRSLLFLTSREFADPQNAEIFVPELSGERMEVVRIEGNATWEDLRRRAAPILFWSPGQEDADGVSRRICEIYPPAALYTLVDDAGLSRSFAADTAGSGWQPGIPAGRWTRHRCGDSLDTEGRRGRLAVESAQRALDLGDTAGAIRILRAVGETTFVQSEAYAMLSRLLATDGSSGEDRGQVIYWMRRANEASLYRKAPLVAELAALYAADGDYSEAEKAAQRAAIVARANGEPVYAAELERAAHDYGAMAR